MALQIRELLKNLCCNNGWCYGLVWGVNRRNSMLLTIEDVHIEESFGLVVNTLLQQVRMLGEGIIGEAAFTGKHRWILSDSSYQYWGPTGSVNNQDVFQDISEFHRQFSCGIKTIALITVAPLGVVQFGSTEKVPESLDFVNHVRCLLQQMGSVGEQFTNYEPIHPNREVYDPSSAVASVISSGSSCPSYLINNTLNDGSNYGLTGNTQCSMLASKSPPFNPGAQSDNMIPLMSNLCQISSEAEFMSSTANMQSPPFLSHLVSNSANSSGSRKSTWSSKGSGWTIFDQQMLSEMVMEESPNAVGSNSNTLSQRNTLNVQGDMSLSSTYGLNGLPTTVDNAPLCHEYSSNLNSTYGINELPKIVDNTKTAGYSLGNVVDHQVSAPLQHTTDSESPKKYTTIAVISSEARLPCEPVAINSNTAVNVSQWTAQSLQQGRNSVPAQVHDSLSQHVHESSKSKSGDNVNVGQDPLVRSVNPMEDMCEEKTHLATQLTADTDMFNSFTLDFAEGHRMEGWDNYILPVVSGSHSSLSTGASECISDFDIGSTAGPQKVFFTDLEQVLEGVYSNTSDTRPSAEDQLSTTTTRSRTVTEMTSQSFPIHSNQIYPVSHTFLGGTETKDEYLAKARVENTNLQSVRKDTELKAHVASWIDDSYSINNESSASRHTKKPEETAKATRRKSHSRESTRPRPKDRQQIQDRVKELREIVPNGSKCSIDALLDRTIKHMLFLQSVAKYSDKLKQVDEQKIIGDDNGVILKDSIHGGGSTWIFEVGGQTMVCPIIVEDLSPPGQMLIEMLCEERGYFLEIADTIRGFGLVILKGVMEIRDDKIWARFIVEAIRNITRMEIFLSLVQLLQQTGTTGNSSKNQLGKSAEGAVPAFTNYHQSPITTTLS